jgi:hypothetical protein
VKAIRLRWMATCTTSGPERFRSAVKEFLWKKRPIFCKNVQNVALIVCSPTHILSNMIFNFFHNVQPDNFGLRL